MQATSKTSRPRNNEHKPKHDEQMIREQGENYSKNGHENESSHLGTPNDYKDNLTDNEDSLSEIQGTIRIAGAENTPGSGCNSYAQALDKRKDHVKVEPSWWLINVRPPEDKKLYINLRVEPPWWLLNVRPPEDQIEDSNPEKLKSEFERKLVESIQGYQDLETDQAHNIELKLNVRVKRPKVFVDYKLVMMLCEIYEGYYIIKEKVTPVVCVTVIDEEVRRVKAVNLKSV
jgi:hypothetical protein